MWKMTYQGQIFVATKIVKGRQTFLDWLGILNVVEWYPFCPGFNFIFKNDRKSYLGPTNGGKKISSRIQNNLETLYAPPKVSILNS